LPEQDNNHVKLRCALNDALDEDDGVVDRDDVLGV
jgi:hypothetical protein